MNWVLPIWEVVRDRDGWNFAVYSKVGCPFADVPVTDTDGASYESCENFRKWAVTEIDALAPATLVLASALKKDLPGADNEEEVHALWGEGVESTLNSLNDIDRVVALGPPPEGLDLASCANRFSEPSDCASAVTGSWVKMGDETRSVMVEKNREYIDTGLWFCQPNGTCPAVIGQHVVRRDTVHMTPDYSLTLAPLLESWLWQPEAKN